MVACVAAVLAAGEGNESERVSPSGRNGGEREKCAAWPKERKKPELLLVVVCM